MTCFTTNSNISRHVVILHCHVLHKKRNKEAIGDELISMNKA